MGEIIVSDKALSEVIVVKLPHSSYKFACLGGSRLLLIVRLIKSKLS